MPTAPLRPCTAHGCPHLQPCPVHPPRRRWQGVIGTRQARGYGAAWQRARAAVLRAGAECTVCGAPAESVDHVVPRSRGGSDELENLRPLCRACHRSKTGREGRAARS